MPADLAVVTNPDHPSVRVEFIDTNGNVIDPPTGVVINFTSSDPNIASVQMSTDAPLKCDIIFGANAGQVILTATISGATDTDGSTFPDLKIAATITPPTPGVVSFVATQ